MKTQKSLFYTDKQLKKIKKKSLKKDIWFPIPGYNGRYEITPQGKIRRKNKKLMYIGKNSKGYSQISITKRKNKRITPTVHALVFLTFYGFRPVDIGLTIDHISEDKLDNSFWNLRALSLRENIARSKDTNSCYSKYPGVKKAPGDKYKYKSSLVIGKVCVTLLLTNDEELASKVYNDAVRALNEGKKVKVYRRTNRKPNMEGLKIIKI